MVDGTRAYKSHVFVWAVVSMPAKNRADVSALMDSSLKLVPAKAYSLHIWDELGQLVLILHTQTLKLTVKLQWSVSPDSGSVLCSKRSAKQPFLNLMLLTWSIKASTNPCNSFALSTRLADSCGMTTSGSQLLW